MDTKIIEFIDETYHVEIPIRFGSYDYAKTLGKGSFSVVVLVKNRITDTIHACKVVSRNLLVQNDIFDRFEQEVRILQGLNHPYIVKIEDCFFDEKNIYVIMEYCSKGELFSYIVREGPMKEETLRTMFRKIVEGLGYVHRHDIAHRDLKPENILLTEDYDPKIIDFGLCHVTDSLKLLETPCGSPFYAPPEIVAHEKYDGKLGDIWSLGVVFYTMATGSLPWTNANQTALFMQIIEANFSIPTNLSPPIQQLLAMMMMKDPKQRPTCEQILAMPWLADDFELDFLKPTSLKTKKNSTSASSFDSRSSITVARSSHPGKRVLVVKPDVAQYKTHRFSLNGKDIPNFNSIIRRVPPIKKIRV